MKKILRRGGGGVNDSRESYFLIVEHGEKWNNALVCFGHCFCILWYLTYLNNFEVQTGFFLILVSLSFSGRFER